MSEYEYDGITSPDECVRLVFEDVLPRTHLSADDHNALVEQMNNYDNRWAATYFLQGPESGTRSLISQSLYQKVNDPRMKSWLRIQLDPGQAVIIHTAHESGLHPQAVWRAVDEYFMLDFEDYMVPLWQFAITKGVTREAFCYVERQQKMKQKWYSHNGQLRCDKCNRVYTSEVSKARFSESDGRLSVMFNCPNCGGVYSSLKLGQ